MKQYPLQIDTVINSSTRRKYNNVDLLPIYIAYIGSGFFFFFKNKNMINYSSIILIQNTNTLYYVIRIVSYAQPVLVAFDICILHIIKFLSTCLFSRATFSSLIYHRCYYVKIAVTQYLLSEPRLHYTNFD